MAAFVMLIQKTYITPYRACAHSVHALQSVHGMCTSFEGTKPHNMYVFGISAVNAVDWITFGKDRRTSLKKSIFIQGSPLWICAVCKVIFWPREGQNLKISEVPIK